MIIIINTMDSNSYPKLKRIYKISNLNLNNYQISVNLKDPKVRKYSISVLRKKEDFMDFKIASGKLLNDSEQKLNRNKPSEQA